MPRNDPERRCWLLRIETERNHRILEVFKFSTCYENCSYQYYFISNREKVDFPLKFRLNNIRISEKFTSFKISPRNILHVALTFLCRLKLFIYVRYLEFFCYLDDLLNKLQIFNQFTIIIIYLRYFLFF